MPVPSDIDKDNNRFEILRGQIIAGNDNPDLIKDFKFFAYETYDEWAHTAQRVMTYFQTLRHLDIDNANILCKILTRLVQHRSIHDNTYTFVVYVRIQW